MLYFWIAALLILTVVGLLLGAKLPAGRAMPIAYLVTVAIALWVWRVPTSTFGAVGTPILIGIDAGLAGVPAVQAQAAALGLTYPAYLKAIGVYAVVQHAVVGTFIPLILAVMLTVFFGDRPSVWQGMSAWKFALFAGLAFTVP